MRRRAARVALLVAACALVVYATASCGEILGLHDQTLIPDEAATEAAAADTGPAANDAGAAADADAAPTPNPRVEVFSSQQDRPYGIAVDGANVYWLDEGTGPFHGALVRQNKSGGSPEITIASALAYPRVLATDAIWLYLIASNHPPVVPVGIDGGTDGGVDAGTLLFGRATKDAPPDAGALVAFVFGNDDAPYKGLALYAGVPKEGGAPSTDVFLAQETSIVRFARDGSSASTIATGLASVSAITADESFAYFATRLDHAIARVPTDGSAAPSPIAEADAVDLAVDADSIYWVSTDGSVSRAPKDGSGPRVIIAAGTNAPTAQIAVDADNVYWVRSNPDAPADGDVYVAKKTPPIAGGGTGRTLATGLDDPRGIAVDRDVLTGRAIVYVTCHGDGRILKVTP
jgi:hypothetical protein